MKILVTGGSGYLGRELINELSRTFEKVYLLVRPKSHERTLALFKKHPNVELVSGDVTSSDVIANPATLKKIQDEVEVIVHAAAHYDIKGAYNQCYMQNVAGTQNMLYLAGQCSKLKFFHYISTIAVSGDHSGRFGEDELELGQDFRDHYAKTKYEAELMFRQWELKDVKKRIYRLGVLVGNSSDGNISKVDGPYYFLKFLAKVTPKKMLINALKYLPMPYEKDSLFPIIPVDHAVRFVTIAVLNPNLSDAIRCYHVIGERSPTMGEFIQDCFDEFGFTVSVVPLPKSKINNMIMDNIGLPQELLTYMYAGLEYGRTQVLADFPGELRSNYLDYKNQLFQFARNYFIPTGAKQEDES